MFNFSILFFRRAVIIAYLVFTEATTMMEGDGHFCYAKMPYGAPQRGPTPSPPLLLPFCWIFILPLIYTSIDVYVSIRMVYSL